MEALSPEIGRFTDVVSGAMQCRFCFALKLRPAFVDLPQPRWIGPDYWITRPRVAVVMLNPGSGTFRSDGADAALRSLLHAFAGGEDRLSEILEHQRRDIPSWGRGRFARFFLEGARLRLEQLALLNLAWCATQSNEYPPEMLHACFSRHTRRLLQALAPELVILSGSATHSFAEAVRQALPNARTHCTLHYAHRKGRRAQADATSELRQAIHDVT